MNTDKHSIKCPQCDKPLGSKKSCCGITRYYCEIAAGKIPLPADSMQRRVKRHKRHCQWMVESRDWEDCGAPAIAMDADSFLAFCPLHTPIARERMGLRLVPLNDQALRHDEK